MAFFAQTGPDAEARLSQQLGNQLGMGAGKAIGENIANKKQLQQQQGLAQMLFGAAQQGNPQAQQMMEQLSQLSPELQIKAFQAMQPKAPAGGITGQPTPPSVGKAIADVMNANQESDADTLALKLDEAGIPRAFSNSYIENRRRSLENKAKESEGRSKAEQQKFESDRTYHSKTSDDIVKNANETLAKAPIKKGLIAQQRRDVNSGNTSGLIPFLVDKTGITSFRNPESARFKTIGKQRFIESLQLLGGAGARPNQFIEQQLVSAQAALGNDELSNNTILDLEEFVDDMETEKAKFIAEEAEKDRDQYGYVRNDVANRSNKRMEDYANKRQDKLAYTIRKRYEDTKDDKELLNDIFGGKIAPDTPMTLRIRDLLLIKNDYDKAKTQAEAKRLGFTIPLESTYREE